MSLLITRPYYDPVTHYFFYWSEEIIKEAKRVGLKLFDLTKGKAVKKKVESYLAKQNPDLVIFNGHGDDFCITGQDDNILISADNNESLLKGKYVYIRACSCGKVLGIKIRNAGAKGFIGYKKSFILLRKIESFRKPLEDEFAKPFLECSNKVGLALVRGCSAKEAHEASIKKYKEKINDLFVSNSPYTFILPYLRANMNNQVCY